MILDSGAFSVWNKGGSIDLDEYIEFCSRHSGIDYFVSLDVIPGRPSDPLSLTPSSVEEACQGSWKNYLKMVSALPEEKVIPVFHQGDSLRWLERYLDLGVPYLGISPANDRTTAQREEWLSGIKKYITDSSGNLITKTHGFAVTSTRLMATGLFYSVDSASWLRIASYGKLMVPLRRKGEWRYDKSYWVLGVSAKSPTKDEQDQHIDNVSPLIRESAMDWIDSLGLKLGRYEIFDADGKSPGEKESWFDKSKTKIVRVVESGVSTSFHQRLFANMRFFQRANKVLPLQHIYFAGSASAIHPEIESRLQKRLLSYHEARTYKKTADTVEHYARMKCEGELIK